MATRSTVFDPAPAAKRWYGAGKKESITAGHAQHHLCTGVNNLP